MAIDRNSYTSLVESVQEAVATPSMANKPATMASKNTGKKTQASGSTSSVSGSVNSGPSAGRTRKSGWGSSSVGGANNAQELAAWLNSQQNQGNQNKKFVAMPSSTAASSSKSVRAAGSGTGKVGSVSSTGVSSGKGKTSSGWGGSNVGGSNNAYDLAAWLNSLQNKGKKPSVSRASTPKMKGGANRGSAISTSAGRTISTSSSAPGSVADSYEWTAEDIEELLAEGYSVEDILEAVEILSEEEDFDVIDEIIAEGIELYGEEDFIAILEHFNETGEIPEELVDLLD